MKTLIVFMTIIGMLFTLTSCGLNGSNITREQLFAETDLIYDDIKTIVTDKDVRPLISNNTLLRLKKAETIYLSAREGLKLPGVADPVDLLIQSGLELVDILNTFAANGKYARQISAARVISKVMLNRIRAYQQGHAES